MTERDPASSSRLRQLRRLLPFLSAYRGLVAGWLGFLLVSSTATLALPQAVRVMIDRGFANADTRTSGGYREIRKRAASSAVRTFPAATASSSQRSSTACTGWSRVVPFV